MARSLQQIQVTAQLKAVLRNTVDSGAASIQQGQDISPSTALDSGTAANQADRVIDKRGIAIASGNDTDIDLYDLAGFNVGGGAGNDALGQATTLAEVVALMVSNRAASEGDLLVGGEGTEAAWSAPFDDDDDAVLVVKPGGCFLLFAPTDPAYPVTDTSNHLLTLAASGGDVTCDVVILGRSA